MISPPTHLFCADHLAWQFGGCRFWKWENKYIQYFSARWGHLISHASVHRHVSLLEENQAWLKNIFVLGVVNLAVMAMIC